MKKSSLLAAGVCLIGLVAAAVRPASAAIVDMLTVTLPHATLVGGVTLPAGEYTVRKLQDNGNSSVFEFASAKVSASVLVMQIPVPDNHDVEKTTVIVIGEGNWYEVDKIWVSGSNHGYQLLSSVKR